MRYAIVSDLHANLPAWNAVHADLCDQGAEVVVCLGDIVGYGPNPAEVLDGVRSVTENCVMGNHDAAAAGILDYSIFNDHARRAIEWTMTVLDQPAKDFLASTPLAIEARDLLFVHAEICNPGRFGYLSTPEIAQQNFAASRHFVTFVGHTHLPAVFEREPNGTVQALPDEDLRLNPAHRYIVNVGSVGEPRHAADLRARYVIYDDLTRELSFRKVEFDIPAYRADLEATTLALRPFFLRVYEQAVAGGALVAARGGTAVDMTVALDSGALVDLDQVAGMAHLTSAGREPRASRPSFLAATILTTLVVAALVLAGVRTLFQKDPEPFRVTRVEPAAAAPPIGNTVPPPRREPRPEVPPDPLIATEGDETARAAPSRSRAPAPVLPAASLPSEPASLPAEPTNPPPPALIESAWWRMDGPSSASPLTDETGRITLETLQEGHVISALAPDPVPAEQVENPAARQLGIWEEREARNHFALTSTHSFTFEGWLFVAPFQSPVFLLGTRSADLQGPGWHLDLRPPARGERTEAIGFYFEEKGAPITATASGLPISDGQAHHFAIVWDHDRASGAGMMELFFDGTLRASARLPHTAINGGQAHPLRIGATINPDRLGLDELRFTRRALRPHEFLRRAPLTGPTMTQSDGRRTDSWADSENWQDGRIPSGDDHAIIAPGVKAQLHHAQPGIFTGSLVLRERSSLHLWSRTSEDLLPREDARLVMFNDSRLVLRSKQETTLGPVEVIGTAYLHGGMSTSGHHQTRRFAAPVSGSGSLILVGVNGTTFSLEAASPLSGALMARAAESAPFKIICASDGGLGQGRVVIGDHASLQLKENLADAIADHATLELIGPKGSLEAKLVLHSREQVASFVVAGEDQGEGTYSRHTHPGLISGDGKLIVKNR